MASDPSPLPRSDSNGPLVLAVVGMVLPTFLLGLMLLRLHIDLTTEFWVFVPGSAIAALAISVSMGWIFLEFGRAHRRPRQLPLTMTLLGLGVILTMLLIIVIGIRTAGQYSA